MRQACSTIGTAKRMPHVSITFYYNDKRRAQRVAPALRAEQKKCLTIDRVKISGVKFRSIQEDSSHRHREHRMADDVLRTRRGAEQNIFSLHPLRKSLHLKPASYLCRAMFFEPLTQLTPRVCGRFFVIRRPVIGVEPVIRIRVNNNFRLGACGL
jgi:hypothetical protein